MNLTELSNKITTAPKLDFGNTFSQAIDLFKKTWGEGILMLLLNVILVLPAILILYIPIFAAIASGVPESNIEAGNLSPWYIIVFVLLFLPVMALVQTIALGLTAGYYSVVKEKDLGLEGGQSNMFMFLKKAYLGKLFLLSVISLGIALLAVMLCYFPVFYVAIPLGLIPVILAYNPELTANEIIKASFQLGNKKWLLLFGLLIVSYLLANIIGMLLCVIGVLFTSSFVYLPYYLVYKQAVGFEEDEKISQIETTDI